MSNLSPDIPVHPWHPHPLVSLVSIQAAVLVTVPDVCLVQQLQNIAAHLLLLLHHIFYHNPLHGMCLIPQLC
jgi:hypothetical protein